MMAPRLTVAVLALAGCLTKPPRPTGEVSPEGCGDGAIAGAETCDDGNADGGDGCSARCTVEPWFECVAEGEPCHPVLSLQWTTPGTDLPALANGGGVAFSHECSGRPGITGPNTVIVGFAGETEQSGGRALTQLRALCADIEIRNDGSVRWENPVETPPEGGAAGTGLGIRMCDQDEVVTGYDGNSNDTEACGIDLFCQAPTHTDGKLRFGTPNKLDRLGVDSEIERAEAHCGPDQVARAFVGRAGAIIDQFTMRCDTTELAVCGDGVTSAFETCDDGNAIDGDACNARCDGD